jgi:hypothetical protein
MDRASWLRVIERWFIKIPAQDKFLAGYHLPSDVPVFAGPLDTREDGTKEHRTIRVTVRTTEAHLHPIEVLLRPEEIWGKYIVPDIEACVLLGEDHATFIPWDLIVFIRA